MSIRFIFGRAGTGKSQFCLKQIDKKINSEGNNKLILLVPDQYTFQSEKKLLEFSGEKSLLRTEVLSFKRMALRVFDKAGGRTENVIEDSGKSMLIYKLLKENIDEVKKIQKIKRLIEDKNMLNDWYDYREESEKEIAKDWCKANNIEYIE